MLIYDTKALIQKPDKTFYTLPHYFKKSESCQIIIFLQFMCKMAVNSAYNYITSCMTTRERKYAVGIAITWRGDLSSRVWACDRIEFIYEVACSVLSNPIEVYNLLCSVSLVVKVRCQVCVCVLSSPWWSRHLRTLINHYILQTG